MAVKRSLAWGTRGLKRKIRDHVGVIRDRFTSPLQVLQALAQVI